jgi:hypothetical protein
MVMMMMKTTLCDGQMATPVQPQSRHRLLNGT